MGYAGDCAACGMLRYDGELAFNRLGCRIGSSYQGARDHEAFRMPELRTAALLREYKVRELWPEAGLSAEAGSGHCIGSGRWRVECARGAGGALSLLRQRRARRLQLARACRG